MSEPVWRIFGMELSPYSVKVRSYFRYKGIPHEWIVRSSAQMAEFQRLAKLPLIPLVVSPEGEALQDSTPILETLERRFPEPALQPDDPVEAFLSALLEEYADEWGNKPMFHYRWTYEADQASAAERIARATFPDAGAEQIAGAAAAIRARMVPRLQLVGSNPATLPAIEASFERQLALLEPHLATRAFLFGGRPALADFGVFAQLYECSIDPTPGAILRARAPRVRAWIERMLAPHAEGGFERWERLEPTLAPLLRDEVGAVFLPWTVANERALREGREELACTIDGRPFTQQPQKYHAKSLAVLRARYAAVTDRARLDPILDRAGCLAALRA
ncbi:MAG TPA: glutathione S-transferase family protein [Myxococcota bacterium]|jgi:glutathione S-transferase|nr:glutathione S-transferase family protein [Myxococcota bacterium]